MRGTCWCRAASEDWQLLSRFAGTGGRSERSTDTSAQSTKHTTNPSGRVRTLWRRRKPHGTQRRQTRTTNLRNAEERARQDTAELADFLALLGVVRRVMRAGGAARTRVRSPKRGRWRTRIHCRGLPLTFFAFVCLVASHRHRQRSGGVARQTPKASGEATPRDTNGCVGNTTRGLRGGTQHVEIQ